MLLFMVLVIAALQLTMLERDTLLDMSEIAAALLLIPLILLLYPLSLLLQRKRRCR